MSEEIGYGSVHHLIQGARSGYSTPSFLVGLWFIKDDEIRFVIVDVVAGNVSFWEDNSGLDIQVSGDGIVKA